MAPAPALPQVTPEQQDAVKALRLEIIATMKDASVRIRVVRRACGGRRRRRRRAVLGRRVSQDCVWFRLSPSLARSFLREFPIDSRARTPGTDETASDHELRSKQLGYGDEASE